VTEPRRHAAVIYVRPEREAEYRALHAAVWPAVIERIARSNIRNYSIFFRDGMLFSYFEYVGDDIEADTAAIAADPATQQWWQLTAPCQQPVATVAQGEWWAPLEEVFHTG
jgi:L-rhamnose mutarotase